MSRFKFFELTEFCTGCRGCCSVRCFLVNDPFLVSTILRIVKNVVHSINFFTFYCLHRHDQGTTRMPQKRYGKEFTTLPLLNLFILLGGIKKLDYANCSLWDNNFDQFAHL
ncbi:hypothetical protein G4B88_016613 [Cannabis sativa]|uniref:Uncharacterized protein n=1 Tax=Cannabis sativa TaxID=3483 RepID=A0A7J6H7P9_CANSA|nr:hypothetical protein G4B88_016613 [Cannabis sativa]